MSAEKKLERRPLAPSEWIESVSQDIGEPVTSDRLTDDLYTLNRIYDGRVALATDVMLNIVKSYAATLENPRFIVTTAVNELNKGALRATVPTTGGVGAIVAAGRDAGDPRRATREARRAMSFTVIRSVEFRADLKEQAGWYVEQGGFELAERYTSAVTETLSRLARHRPEVHSFAHRFLLLNEYIVQNLTGPTTAHDFPSREF